MDTQRAGEIAILIARADLEYQRKKGDGWESKSPQPKINRAALQVEEVLERVRSIKVQLSLYLTEAVPSEEELLQYIRFLLGNPEKTE